MTPVTLAIGWYSTPIAAAAAECIVGCHDGAVNSPAYPPVRSYRLRRRRLSPDGKVDYLRRSARWALPTDGEELDWDQLFPTMPTPVDVVLDIGFGGGEALIALAKARPNEAAIGIDVHTNGVAKVLEAIEFHDWKHVFVVEADVLDFLPRVPINSLAGIRLFFPDPWPKTKQRHRRLARVEVVGQLVDRLRVGGTLHFATDAVEYAAQTQLLCDDEVRLRGGVVPRPTWRPVTRFETRGIAAGRQPIDLIYERVS